MSSSPTTYTYGSTTYYRVNPWYRRVLKEDEDGYVRSSAPVGHKEDEPPDKAEEVQVDGEAFYYADGAFWQKASGGGFVVVAAPVGAEVSSVPEDAVTHDEDDTIIYQFDQLYLAQDTNDAGKTIYRVQPAPPQEEITSIPEGSPSFVADEETYYYVESSFYVAYEENGKKGFVNGEPDEGAQTEAVPKEAESFEDDGDTYYQFDTVFFEEVEDDDGTVFYEVVGSPDGSDEVIED